jgi:pyrimidine operon attenuation protein/uracil phosphoribosyltransferase
MPPISPLAEPSPGRVILDAAGVTRALTRIAHEIMERETPLESVVLLGVQRGGVALAEQLAGQLRQFSGLDVPQGTIDVSFYRDDLGTHLPTPEASVLPCDLTGRVVVLVDSVLFTGRTIRAAMDAVNDFGRPARVRLAVLVDRGHRELPVAPDYVGKNLPTAPNERVRANAEVVMILPPKPSA